MTTQAKLSTEEKIKKVAKKVFQQKGYSATRTRDIAKAASINIALLNYYFGSKKKLFDIVMFETLEDFFDQLESIRNDQSTLLSEKIKLLTEKYIEMLNEKPHLPLFLINEMNTNPNIFFSKICKRQMKESIFECQLREALTKNSSHQQINHHHFMMSFISMIIFPFVMSPLIQTGFQIQEKEFHTMMEERKKLIPLWMESILKA